MLRSYFVVTTTLLLLVHWSSFERLLFVCGLVVFVCATCRLDFGDSSFLFPTLSLQDLDRFVLGIAVPVVGLAVASDKELVSGESFRAGEFETVTHFLCHFRSLFLGISARRFTRGRIYCTMNSVKKQDLVKLSLPDTPGVYFWKDKEGNILYIGKATSLRDRTLSYFAKDIVETRGLRIVNMVLAADKVEYQETASVLEALLLENVLIKKHQPPFNAKEKDNKTYTCVVITKEDYPRVLTMRLREYEKRFVADGSIEKVDKVYGPFSSASQIKEALRIIRKMFPFRDRCELHQSKPCFNASIKLCPGTCVGMISKEEYKSTIKNIKNLFEGKRETIIKDLEKQMNQYSKSMEFEKAARVRNTLFALDHIKDVSLIKNEDVLDFKNKNFRIEAYDVAHISGSGRVGVMTVVINGKKATDEYRKFKLDEKVNDDYQGIRDMIMRRMSHMEWGVPDLIVFDGGEGQKAAGEQALASLGLQIQTCSVVKDKSHKARDILTNYPHIKKYEEAILLANYESHRFAINYHKLLRDKKFLG